MAEVRQHFAELQVARFKWPERIEHLADLPRTLVGKTDKKRLQAEIAGKIAAELAANQPRPAGTAGGTP
jgi:non-ribosomal peptide synthetase component E (peptide arylation enzyme)